MPIRRALDRANWYTLPLAGNGHNVEYQPSERPVQAMYRPVAADDEHLELRHTSVQDMRYWHEEHITFGDFSPIMIRHRHSKFATTCYLALTAPLRELGA